MQASRVPSLVRELDTTYLHSPLSPVRLFVTPWTRARQAPLSMGFSRQEYWSGLPFPPPGDLPDPGIEPVSPALAADSLPLTLYHRGNSLKSSLDPTCHDENVLIAFCN